MHGSQLRITSISSPSSLECRQGGVGLERPEKCLALKPGSDIVLTKAARKMSDSRTAQRRHGRTIEIPREIPTHPLDADMLNAKTSPLPPSCTVPYMNSVSAVLIWSALASACAPCSSMPVRERLRQRFPLSCQHSLIPSQAHWRPRLSQGYHSSVVSVVLVLSASASARAPASPIVLIQSLTHKT